jgi:hypothetical protein
MNIERAVAVYLAQCPYRRFTRIKDPQGFDGYLLRISLAVTNERRRRYLYFSMGL